MNGRIFKFLVNDEKFFFQKITVLNLSFQQFCESAFDTYRLYLMKLLVIALTDKLIFQINIPKQVFSLDSLKEMKKLRYGLDVLCRFNQSHLLGYSRVFCVCSISGEEIRSRGK